MGSESLTYAVWHHTMLRYTDPVGLSFNEVRMRPRDRGSQRTLAFSLLSNPSAVPRSRVDYFGNYVHRVDVTSPHDALEFVVDAIVENSEPRRRRLPEWSEDVLAGDPRLEYVLPSPRVPLSDATRRLWHEWNGEDRSFDAVLATAERIPRELRYVTGATTVESTIDDLLAGGAGVCQDFSHLFLAMVRAAGWPARYVSGYLGPTGDQAFIEGQSHAWAEVCGADGRWVGLDPTHGGFTGAHHLRLAVGRDYSDVAPHRGLYFGASEGAPPEVRVRITRVSHQHVETIERGAAVHWQQQQQQQQLARSTTARGVSTSDAPGPTRVALEPVDAVTITTLIDNVTDVFMPDQGPAHRPALMAGPKTAVGTLEGPAPDSLLAEHGFSVLISLTKGDREHSVLFDAGVTPNGLVENMRRLGVDPADLEAIVCSHGHFDHTTGLDGLVRRLGRTNLPVLLHPEFWNRRRVVIPGGTFEMPTTSRGALEAAGFQIVEERQPSFLFESSLLVTGEVDRTTGYEPGFPIQQAWRDAAWQPDPLVLDDQAVVLHVAGKGLVVITGCGHAGVVNICRYASRLTGVDEFHAVIGGFHLNGPLYEPLIGRVCADLQAMAPSVVVPAHCTGWRAQHALARAFPEAFVPNSVGTRFVL